MTDHDLRRLLASIRELSVVSRVDDFHTHAVRVLHGLVGGDWFASEVFESGTVAWQAGVVDPEIPDDLHGVFKQLAHEHPISPLLKDRSQGFGVATWSSVVGDRDAHRSLAVFNEFYRALGISQQASAYQHMPGGSVLVHTVSRSGDFDEVDLRMLELMRPHLSDAYRAWRDIQALRSEPAWLVDGLESMEAGLGRV